MTRKFRLASVLRARRAQEDMAKGEVVRARAAAEAAVQRRAHSERALAVRGRPDSGTSRAYAAALSARQALAGELALAVRLADDADRAVRGKVDGLTEAAVRRRTMEKLADRHAEAVERADAEAGQQLIDEIASTRRRPAGEVLQ